MNYMFISVIVAWEQMTPHPDLDMDLLKAVSGSLRIYHLLLSDETRSDSPTHGTMSASNWPRCVIGSTPMASSPPGH